MSPCLLVLGPSWPLSFLVHSYPQFSLPLIPTSCVFWFLPLPSVPTHLNVTMQQQNAMLFPSILGKEFLFDPFGVKSTHGTHSGILASLSPMWFTWLASLARDKTSRAFPRTAPLLPHTLLQTSLSLKVPIYLLLGDALSLACRSGKMAI